MKLTGYTIGIVVATSEQLDTANDGPLVERILEGIRQAQNGNELVDVRILDQCELGSVFVNQNGSFMSVTFPTDADIDAEVVVKPVATVPVTDDDCPF